MKYRKAELSDIEDILQLHGKYHADSVSDADRADGFVTTQFDKQLLANLITEENGLFIAADNSKIIAYVMCASWGFCSRWPMFQYMISRLHEIDFLDQNLDVSNSYQYGPICIDRDYRGTGVLENIFDFARIEMSKKFQVLVTFINKVNTRSFRAHTVKLGLLPVMDFEYNGRNYIELVYDTSKPIAARASRQAYFR